ncbi:hypothetical protein UAS_00564 [Enterococcus asini ATCC 700915]|uniref:Uncharacterized protein n=1 Tax=Enterococcus asini ATCC 700915 TaxID=1158606 RepID=R2S1Z5_9ENTE|nr:hypothetical protein [Enterococcus asini]EOH89450.1 hypothetical protein UAS_00564 [Enterococcus asini ATCC 700915]EOT56531.1 hypothetical protein I579_00030 [Enterococcus asini ATCC 700915]
MKTVKLTNDDLMKYVVELTNLSQQAKVLKRLAETVEYARVTGDDFSLKYQINSGLLGEIGDSLKILEKDIQRISNEICPD